MAWLYSSQTVGEFSPWFETKAATDSQIHAYFFNLGKEKPVGNKNWVVPENDELRRELMAHLMSKILLTDTSPGAYQLPFKCSSERLWTRLAELDLGIKLMKQGLHRDQAGFEELS